MSEPDEGVEGSLCEHCEKGRVWWVSADDPYSVEHYICDTCFSTFIYHEGDRRCLY